MKVKSMDLQPGKVDRAEMFMLPPAPDCCQECGIKHPPEQPHNQQSIYYQFKFFHEHGRSPTWLDAMAHCDEPMKAFWKAELEKEGVVFTQKEVAK